MSRATHIGLEPGEAGRYALLPGDPGRVPLIAERLDGLAGSRRTASMSPGRESSRGSRSP
jgi:uridine phosphorylase